MLDFIPTYDLIIDNLSLFSVYIALYISYCVYWQYTNNQTNKRTHQQDRQSISRLPKARLSPLHALIVCLIVCFSTVWAINTYERSDAFLLENAVKRIVQGIPDDEQSINQSINRLPNLIGTIPFDVDTATDCINEGICLIESSEGSGKSTALRTLLAGKPGVAFSLQSNNQTNHQGAWSRFAAALDIVGKSNDKSQKLVRSAFERAAMEHSVKSSINLLNPQIEKLSFYVLIDDIHLASNAELRLILSWAMSQALRGGHVILLSNGGFGPRLKQLGGLAQRVTMHHFKEPSGEVIKRHLSTTHSRAAAHWMPLKERDINALVDVCGGHPACTARVLVPMAGEWDTERFHDLLNSAQSSYVHDIQQCLMSPLTDFTIVHPEGYSDELVMAELGLAIIAEMRHVVDDGSIVLGLLSEGVRKHLITNGSSDHWKSGQLRDGLIDVIDQFVRCNVLSFDQTVVRWGNGAVARAARSQSLQAFDFIKEARVAAKEKQTASLHSDL